MILVVENLACGYKRRTVIENVSFQLSKGEVLCLFGPNGVGKTTFFKTLLGFLKSLNGTILINNQSLNQMNRETIAKNIAYVPQAHQMAFAFKVIDVVVLGRLVYMGKQRRPSREDYKKAREALNKLQIMHLEEKLYTELSGGERQMVLIARALTQEAPILIMDEPTSNLDYGNQIKVMEQIQRLRQQKFAVIMTTHSPEQVLLCGDQVIVFYGGKLIRTGAPKDIMTPQLIKDIYNVEVSKIKKGDGNFYESYIPALQTSLS
ncbi:ABC transporter ATP-binding protein [Anaerosacchariphilus polymeriproducens]|uniref:ABC transporter ATP-binding protein n=1 Tax=Anaerosacchariphilus polymeriproducens TaxID=1812858 RepID=A0A371AXH2_9FIRM|nr:ABC transporter ATP-binding protein [Anaerosacchariphilus polymeriproducens]RDU24257.1 ABC transporter ATP-binding protein [Anaerosacchariphilus polymeriproducens]